MTDDYKDFIYQFEERLSQSDIERLEEIAQKYTGEGIDSKSILKGIWDDVTKPYKKGEKQEAWKEFGSDQIFEWWALDVKAEITNGFNNFEMTQEALNDFEEMNNILGQLIDS